MLKDLLTGRIQFMFATVPSVIAHIKAGTLVAIAVSRVKRSRSMPDVPTVARSGFPRFEAGSWFGIFAPRGTPPVDEGAEPAGGPPEKVRGFREERV